MSENDFSQLQDNFPFMMLLSPYYELTQDFIPITLPKFFVSHTDKFTAVNSCGFTFLGCLK